jgi:hypothetical protein
MASRPPLGVSPPLSKAVWRRAAFAYLHRFLSKMWSGPNVRRIAASVFHARRHHARAAMAFIVNSPASGKRGRGAKGKVLVVVAASRTNADCAACFSGDGGALRSREVMDLSPVRVCPMLAAGRKRLASHR